MTIVLKSDAIQWHEGMLLLPQHFQQNDIRQRQLTTFHVSLISPYHWGLRQLEIETSLLINGILQITDLEAVLPDGLVISHHASEGEFVETDLTQYQDILEKSPQLVYLAVRTYVNGAANALGKDARYVSKEGDAVVDENTGQGEIRIPRLVPNVTLFIGKKPPSTYTFFPIMRIGFESNAYVKKVFVPPILKVRKDSSLGKLCTQISSRIREKVAYLSERMLNRVEGYMTNEAENAIRALSTSLIPFEAMLNSQSAHPFQLYISLCGLAGHVSGLHPAQMPPSFDPYDHDDLETTYNRVTDFIFLMIDRIQEGYAVVPFEKSGRDFILKLRKEWISDRYILGAKAPVEMSMSELSQWVKDCVIVTDSSVTSSMDNRVLGLERKIISADERLQLVPANGVILFEAKMDPHFVKPDEFLHVFNVSDTDDKRPIEVVMYVPKD